MRERERETKKVEATTTLAIAVSSYLRKILVVLEDLQPEAGDALDWVRRRFGWHVRDSEKSTNMRAGLAGWNVV